MKFYNNSSIEFICCIVLILVFNANGFSQQNIEHSQQVIHFSNTELKLNEALDEICKHINVIINKSNNEKYSNYKVVFSSKKIELNEAFEQIKQQTPFEIINHKRQLTIKERILEKSYSIKGVVIDNKTNIKMAAAQVFISKINKGVVTNEQGEYEITLKPGTYQINCRFIGYKTQSKTVYAYSNKTINFYLEVEQQEIQEVKVTESLYRHESFDIGRPIEHIDGKVVSSLSKNNINDALHGRINGVWATKTSGAPGDHSSIKIRGISSIFASTDPLYIVDGMMIPVVNSSSLGIADLNTHDIKNITVLKDASATALYGFLGGNGVVLIETKKGGNENSISFDAKYGIQRFSERYNTMETDQFINTMELSDANINTRFYRFEPAQEEYQRYPRYIYNAQGDSLVYDNYQDELFNKGTINEYQLSGQGNLKGLGYYISGNYFKHEGVVINSAYTKYAASANITKTIAKRIPVSLSYKTSHQENDNNLNTYMGNDVIFKGINFEPGYRNTPDTFLMKTERIFINRIIGSSLSNLANTSRTPEQVFNEQGNSKIENTNTFSGDASYKINELFSLRANLALSYRNWNYESFIPDITDVYLASSQNTVIFSQHYDLAYSTTNNGHAIDGFIRYRNYHDNIYWQTDSSMNVFFDYIAPDNRIYIRGSSAIFGKKGAVTRSINSGIANLNYNYKTKYFVSGMLNFEKLAEGNYTNIADLYTSIALNWDIAKEVFLPIPTWLESFNLSVNYGISGNYPLNSLSNDLFLDDKIYNSNNIDETATIYSNLANHHLKQESISEYNFGLSTSLFNHRINLSGNYYIKKHSDLLIMRDIPLYYGGGSMFQNIGEMKSSGYELSLELVPVQTKNFYWSTKFGGFSHSQKISKLYNGEPLNFNNDDILFPDFYLRENEAPGDITGYKYIGKWDEIYPEKVEDPEYIKHMGLAYWSIDSLSPNRITPGDKTVIGNSIPKFNLNWLNVINYKGFSCEMLWYGALGFDKYNATKASTYLTGVNSEVFNIISDSMNYITDNVFYESSFFVEDASFIRLKTLSFVYNQQKKIANRIQMRYRISFENLITITNYSGYDPEATIYTKNSFTDNAVDKGAYPNPKGVYFSIGMTF